MTQEKTSRRSFLKRAAAAGAVAAGSGMTTTRATAQEASKKPKAFKKIKVGVIGCGSVSTCYLPDLSRCRFVELVSTCDIIYSRAKSSAAKYKVPNHYPHINKMLAGAKFDLLVNLTDMQEHGRLNRHALQAGKHVWSEKPIATNLADGQELLDLAKAKEVRLWGAPTVVLSPQFAFMAKTISSGKLGRVAAGHGSYGHHGPTWSAFFYEKNGGSMPDLAVYNFTMLTGLLGPARAVIAMTSIITPTRHIGKPKSWDHWKNPQGKTKVEAEDNAMVTMDHGGGVLSHVQSSFNYYPDSKLDHYKSKKQHTVTINGRGGVMHLVGYDWRPHGVDLATEERRLKRHATEVGNYSWQMGGSHAAECLATGKESLVTAEQAVHVAEIMAAARQSQRTGRRIKIHSTFKWPIVS